MMHRNGPFAWEDREGMLAFVQDVAFSTIFIPAEDGAHFVHVPVVVHGPGALRFHVARRNRAASVPDGARAFLSCMGPDAYISPDWYGTPDKVPTWNYVVVEIEGCLRRLGEKELVAQLDALSDDQEGRLAPKPAWTRAKMTPGRFEAMTGAIVGYELVIDAMRGTRKLGQNKAASEHEGSLAGLRALGRHDMADLMAAEFDAE